MLYSQMGGKCLDAQGASNAAGTKMIGYNFCHGASNEIFWFNQNGTISQGRMCLDVRGGQGHDGDPVILFQCTGAPNQIWHMQSDGTIRGMNGKCLDLAGGYAQWLNPEQQAILYTCNGGANQKWLKGVVAPANKVSGGHSVQPGQQTQLSPIQLSAADVSRIVASGAGNARGSNVIAAGAGNVIAAGAGNVIAAGAGNVIAAGAGNVVVLTRN